MARKLPELGPELVTEIEAAWAQPQEDWARRRLLVEQVIAQHELTVAEIIRIADVARHTVFTFRDIKSWVGSERLFAEPGADEIFPIESLLSD